MVSWHKFTETRLFLGLNFENTKPRCFPLEIHPENWSNIFCDFFFLVTVYYIFLFSKKELQGVCNKGHTVNMINEIEEIRIMGRRISQNST